MEIEVVAPVLKVQRSSLRNWRHCTFLLSVGCSAQYHLTKSWCTSLLPHSRKLFRIPLLSPSTTRSRRCMVGQDGM